MVSILQLNIEPWDHQQNQPRKMASLDWKRPALEILLNVYRDHPILYDMRHPKYYAKLERQKALNTIIEMLEDHRPGTTTGDILKKIQTMRTQFGQEYNKVRKAQAKGTEYIPTVWWYEYLKFLRQHIKPRAALRDDTEDSQEGDEEYMSVTQTNEEYEKYETYAPEEQYEVENEGESEIVYEIQSTQKSIKSDYNGEPKFIRKREFANVTPISGNEEIIYEITNSNTIVPKRKIEMISSTPVTAEPKAKIQRKDSVTEQQLPSPKVTAEIKKADTSEITVEPDRCKSFGQFVASQIAAVKDDFLFYSTQMEVLNVINKAQLKQLQMDKDSMNSSSKS
nr:uncharacterized protein LOC109424056 [Aedes albopictus]